MGKLTVIIPTLNAEKYLPGLLQSLKTQSRQADEILVIDSESDDGTVGICRKNDVRLIQIKREDFDHGRTRDAALRQSAGDIVVFLTQDAVPADDRFLANLISPLKGEGIAVSTGRQLPKGDASRIERLVRAFNYPTESFIRSKADLPRMGIKTFFCSDACAAYNREVYLELGGFDYPVLTNEDMFFAAKAINSGYSIAYATDAMVYHSHHLSLREQYRRNYIQGYEIERHRKELHGVTQESEGIKLVRYVSKELLKHGQIGSFIYFGFDCCARLMGSKAGKVGFHKGEAIDGSDGEDRHRHGDL